MAGPIRISILANASQAKKELSSISKQTATFGSKLKNAGRVAGTAMLAGTAVAGAAVIKFGTDAVKAASDAQQSLGATETVFGKFAGTVIKESNKAATQFGLDASTYRENANLIGSLFSNQGVAANKLAGSTKQIIGVGADLAATFGGTTTEAVSALGAAFKGEYDSLEKYGISLNQTKVNAELAARGQDTLTGAARAQAEQQVKTDLILQQTSKTQGAFAKESNTLAGQQQRLAAEFTNIKASIGTALLPVLTSAIAFIRSTVLPTFERWYGIFKTQILPVILQVGGQIASVLLPVLQTMGNFIMSVVVPAIGSLVSFFVKYQAVILPVVAGVVAMVAAFKTYQTILKIIKGAQVAFIAVQTALNVVMAANPIGLVVLAIVGLVAAFVVAYKRSEAFRNIVDKVFNAIKGTISSVWNFLKSATVAAWNFIKNAVTNPVETLQSIVSGAFNAIKGFISSAWNSAKNLTSNAWNAMKNAVSNGVDAVMNFVKGIPGKITGALGDLGGLLLDAGRAIMQGLLDGIESAWGAVQDKLNWITDRIPDWKGPADKDAALLKDAGRLIMQGLVDGITEGAAGVQSKLESITTMISKHFEKKGRSDKRVAELTKAAVKTLNDEVAALKANANARKANNDKLKEAVDAHAALVATRRKEMGLDKTLNDFLDENASRLSAARDEVAALTDQRDKENGVIKTNNDRLEQNARGLDTARSKLQSLKDEAISYAKAIRDNMVSFGSITSLINNEDIPAANAGNVIQALQNKVDKAAEFAALIQRLAASGLNQTNLDQLIQGGVDAGFATARALSDGGPAAIAQINTLTQQLAATGQTLGDTMSAKFHDAGINSAAALVTSLEGERAALYASGIAAGQATIDGLVAQREAIWNTGIQAAAGLVQGFESMEEELEKAGNKLARKLLKAIRKALDIKSPSREFKKIGTYATDGLILGLDERRVERAGALMARRLTSGFGDPRLSATSVWNAQSGGSNTPIPIEIELKAPHVDQLSRGRSIQIDLDAYRRAGGRATA